MGIAPGEVVLEFSEPLSPRLSRAEATDPSGDRFSGGVPISTREEMRVPLTGNAPGLYTVDWTSVSATDGHQLSGSFQFGVRVAVGTSSTQATQLHGDDLSLAIVRWAEVTALLVAMGMVVVAALAAGPPRLTWVRPRYEVISFALAAGLVTVWGEAARATGRPDLAGMGAYLTAGTAGYARLARLGLELLALVAAVTGARLRWLGGLLGGALIALASSGHGASLRPAWEGVVVDAVHLIAAGLWAGTIIALAGQRPPSGWRSPEGRALLVRFSPIALAAFATSVVFGALQALQEVGTLSALTHTGYGTVLLVKVALIALMIPLSLVAWRRRRPHFRVEAPLAALVVGAAALLGSFPTPPTQVVATSYSAIDTGFPQAGELTLADHAGSVVVGLTLDPGMPGRNRLILYLLPLQGQRAASTLRPLLAINGTDHPALSTCGITCRATAVTLRGGDEIDVTVPGGTGGIARLTIPSLPAPDGSALLSRAQTRIHQLQSYRLHETLSSGAAAFPGDYAFAAPNRFTSLVNQSETISIGTTRWTRDGPDQGWRVESGGPSLSAPTFTWDYFSPYIAPRIVGTAAIDSVPTTVVSFFGASGETPVWFRLWIDDTGRVRQAHMTAQGHFMQDHYFAFDAAPSILPPVAAGPSTPSPPAP